MKTPAPTTTPATFTHTIRPAITNGFVHHQRFYGIEAQYLRGWVDDIHERVGNMVATANVHRDTNTDLAALNLVVAFYAQDEAPIKGPAHAFTTMHLSPHSLRHLAMALLDAAHDIEANPARTLANTTSKAAG